MRRKLPQGVVYGLLVAACLAAAVYSAQKPPGRTQAPAGPAPVTSTALPAPAEPGGPRPRVKLYTEELRQRYPYVSLAELLKYEAAAKKAAPPRLTAEARKRLEATEKGFNAQQSWSVRAKSLQMLHSGEVENFISREGFGRERMPVPSPRYLEFPPTPPIAFAPAPSASLGQDDAPRVALSGKGTTPAGTPGLFPSTNLLMQFHDNGRFDFYNVEGLGHVKDRDHVAGFQPHQFRYTATAVDLRGGRAGPAAPPAKERWLIQRLELVSLLKHEKPAVYVSRHLPRMQELKKAPTRPLDDFEGQALQALQEGEDLQAEATPNHIRMLGSIRAARQCLDCHEVKRGELLGAFSYDLRRDPPLP
jgi:hypothetical protein